MLEVLIAIMIFAFGAIGATGMQVLATQANHEATQRTQAVYLSTDIIERMRNNPSAITDYDASADTDWTIVGVSPYITKPSPACDTAACSIHEKAAYDLWTWEQALLGTETTRAGIGAVGGLQDPTGCIRQQGDGRIEVAIAWRGRQSMSNATVAQDCTSEDDRYGDDNEYRRVLLIRTYIRE
jgi:type IV pilus assembly protein PilV